MLSSQKIATDLLHIRLGQNLINSRSSSSIHMIRETKIIDSAVLNDWPVVAGFDHLRML